MRILHVSRRYVPEIIGGYEYNCQRFSEEWVRRGHEVTILTRQPTGATAASREMAGVRIVRDLDDVSSVTTRDFVSARIYQSRIGLANRRNRAATRNILRSWRPDVAVFWGMHSLLVAPILATRAGDTPCLFDLGDYWLAEALRMYSSGDRLKRLYRQCVLLGGRFEASMVDAALVHSLFMRDYYVDAGLAAAALEVIPRGIDPRYFEAGDTRPAGPDGRPVRILCVGRLVPDKGALGLLRAFLVLERSNPGVELHFLGDADTAYEEQVRAESRQSGLLDKKIFLHGAVAPERMPGCYAQGDILAFPVLWDEPSSNVLLEAMAVGLPIVASRTGSNPEFVRHDETGLLVERDDARDLQQALGRLCADAGARSRMGQAGRELVRCLYVQRDVYDRTESWLRSAKQRVDAAHRSGGGKPPERLPNAGLNSSRESGATFRRTTDS